MQASFGGEGFILMNFLRKKSKPTPLKFNMEPKNNLLEKGDSGFGNPSFLGSTLNFGGEIENMKWRGWKFHVFCSMNFWMVLGYVDSCYKYGFFWK